VKLRRWEVNTVKRWELNASRRKKGKALGSEKVILALGTQVNKFRRKEGKGLQVKFKDGEAKVKRWEVKKLKSWAVNKVKSWEPKLKRLDVKSRHLREYHRVT
jgi:hypothetical protein